jgi:hypothetical protein
MAGGSGLLGSLLAGHLRDAGHDVASIALLPAASGHAWLKPRRRTVKMGVIRVLNWLS